MSKLVPELHDLGKLISHNLNDIPTTDGRRTEWHGPEAFVNIDWKAVGRPEPNSATWLGAKRHHDREYDGLDTSPAPDEIKADIILLKIADNLAATSSRAVEDVEEFKKDWGFSDKDNFFRVFKLWRDKLWKDNKAKMLAQGDPEALPVKTKNEFLKLVEMAEKDDASEFYARYKDSMDKIPEDKAPISSVTSFATHYRLVNQFYNILKRHVSVVSENGKPNALKYKDIPAKQRGQAKDLWQFQLLKCRLAFPQTLVRVRDLNIFNLLEGHIETLSKSSERDYLLFHTTDTVWLFLPTDGNVNASKALKPFLDDGFFVEIDEFTFALSNMNLMPKDWRATCLGFIAQYERDEPRVQSLLENEKRELQRIKKMSGGEKKWLGRKIPELEHRIRQLEAEETALEESLKYWKKNLAAFEGEEKKVKVEEASLYAEPILSRTDIETATICELCQLRAATREWTTPDEMLVENLCEVCYGIRSKGEHNAAIGRWERETPNALTAWVKVSLDYDRALFHLRYLFDDFVGALTKEKPGFSKQVVADTSASLRPVGLLSDLTEDFRKFTWRFHELLQNPPDSQRGFRPDDIARLTNIYRDFYIIRLRSAGESMRIVETFRQALDEFFPRILEDCPIRLTVSVANIKHPFFDHWSFCRESREAINLQVVGRAQLYLSPSQYDELKTLPTWRREVGTFLHRVAVIEAKTKSRILPQVEFMQDERKLPQNIATAIKAGKLGWRDILGYYKIVRR